MKIKVSEAQGTILDWMVLTAILGKPAPLGDFGTFFPWEKKMRPMWRSKYYDPTTNWAQGGPIIDREFISVINADGDDVWSAYPLADDPVKHRKSGPTPLIAAMRCFVANKLGDEVEVPDSLT